jgi:hypothetical protein
VIRTGLLVAFFAPLVSTSICGQTFPPLSPQSFVELKRVLNVTSWVASNAYLVTVYLSPKRTRTFVREEGKQPNVVFLLKKNTSEFAFF